MVDNMKQMDQIRLEIEQFRAIEKADIALNGITVVAGENGSGKSTLSKFLYYVFITVNEYDELMDRRLLKELQKYFVAIERGYHELTDEQISYPPDLTYAAERRLAKDTPGIRSLKYNMQNEQEWRNSISTLIALFEKTKDKKSAGIIRLEFILRDVLNINQSNSSDLKELLIQLEKQVQNAFEVSLTRKMAKQFADLEYELSWKFLNQLPQEYRVTEYGSVIMKKGNTTFVPPHSIQRIAYFDTPMLLGVDTDIEHWIRSDGILHNEPDVKVPLLHSIQDIISNEIIGGETYYDAKNAVDNDTRNHFMYKRKDGSEFDLLECATGLKSFAILQMLLKNGFLNKYTLLVLDEPESHLHPQWIVEYARLIVLLNKHIGVKFFIASHNPDMVSAIKYISEQEKVDDNLNFYLAQQTDTSSYTYTYKTLGTDIEPIFESFNIALDRISQYGPQEDQEV